MTDSAPENAEAAFENPTAGPAPKESAFFRWWGNIELSLAAFFLLTMFVGVLWQVLGRYVHELNWPGAGEIARYSLTGITFILIGYLIGKNGQITVAVIDNIAKGRAQVIVKAVAALLLAVICALLTWEAWAMFQSGFSRTTTVLQVPLAYVFALPLVGLVSGTVRAVIKIFHAKYDEADSLTLEEAEA
ncbi:TRAP transporter small permease [Ruicaihuangia caeni]|uniref:TRAP transporter small permease n=1 Tax=Ruicaihuangia caeni TaxID=3042517 RepID=UPI00338E912C